MSKSATLAGALTLALATLPIVALATGANAAPAPVAIDMVDLRLDTAAGMQEFDRRAAAAVRKFCRNAASAQAVAAHNSCKVAVRAEIAEKLDAHRTALAQAGKTTLASR